jgi:hypothetical protein
MMFEIGPQLSINFRQEILTFFNNVQSAESFAWSGCKHGKDPLSDSDEGRSTETLSGGKIQPFLADRVDLNRLFVKMKQAFYELMLSSIVLGLSKHENNTIRAELVDLDAKLLSHDPCLLCDS